MAEIETQNTSGEGGGEKPYDTVRGRMAEGCCSAVSPCSWQRTNPTTICDVCRAASPSVSRWLAEQQVSCRKAIKTAPNDTDTLTWLRAQLAAYEAAHAYAVARPDRAVPAAKGGREEAEALINAARELFGYASYAEIVNGISVNRPQIRKWCDKTIEAIHALEASLDAAASPPPPAGATGGGSGDLGALSAALAPFAEAWRACLDIGEQGAGYVQDDQDAWISGNKSGGAHPLFKFGDLRRAAEALAAHSAPTSDLGAQGEPVAHPHPAACYDFNRRKLTRVEAAWERDGALNDGEICFLIRMAQQRLYEIGAPTNEPSAPTPDYSHCNGDPVEAPATQGEPVADGWKMVPAKATRDWAYALATYRQGQSSTPRCEGPTQRDVEWGMARIREILASAPAAPRSADLSRQETQAARDVLAERHRQFEGKRFSHYRDDGYALGELGLAAALYALPYDARVGGERLIKQDDFIGLDMALEIACGWTLKPDTDPRRRLVKAGALILAEIERLDRASLAQTEA